ncbi:MAG TPA: roadblock/LC7 domain-containing protein [Nitrospirota bacterium]|nr:roadblock/LC7 domain-containing protein [Nitrospirota bacterium]
MPFSDILKEVVNGTEGALGALVVGLDGIPVDEYSVGGEMDLQSMTVEYSALLKEIEKGSQAAQLGTTKEVTVVADKALIMLRRLTEEYFLVLIIRPDGNFGKGRFLLRMSVPKLLKEF